MIDWSEVWTLTGSGWGGHVGFLRTVCTSTTDTEASITVEIPGECQVHGIEIHHLIGKADDSFNVFVGDVYVGMML